MQADPRDRLAQLSPKALRKMFLPETVPVAEVDAEKEDGKQTVVIVQSGGKGLGDLLKKLLDG